MVDPEIFREIALSLPETTEQPHFEKTSFRVGKKIFATLDTRTNPACVKLSETHQDVFSAFDRTVVFPVPNKWGLQGWTNIDLVKVNPELLADAVTMAYCEVAPKRLSDAVRPKEDRE